MEQREKMRAGLLDMLARVERATTFEQVYDVLASAGDELGYSRFAYVTLRLTRGLERPMAITNYPHSWYRHYSENSYLQVDPIIGRAYSGILPIAWSKDDESLVRTRAEMRVIDEGSEFGLNSGITIPVHGNGMEFGTFTVSSDENPEQARRRWDHVRHDLHILGLHCHERVRQLVSADSTPPPSLTLREKECLLWTARGKTAWEISEILTVSEETVRFHLNNAKRKLDVYSKPHAVVKAIMTGLIFP